MSARPRPMRSVDEVLAYLKANPDEPFVSSWGKDRLLIGTRNDQGEIVAWDCNVQASKMEYDRRASPSPETRTAAAPETRTGEGARCWHCGNEGCRTCGLNGNPGCSICGRLPYEDDGEGPRSPSPREGTP